MSIPSLSAIGNKNTLLGAQPFGAAVLAGLKPWATSRLSLVRGDCREDCRQRRVGRHDEAGLPEGL
jgi:hypothetical protein